jgi:hypothetical protein
MTGLLLTLALSTLPSLAAPKSPPEAPASKGAVRVLSGPCEDRSHALESGGFAFAQNGKSYVVTSHHRVFNGSKADGVCHWVSRPESKNLEAELRAWDWGQGMALLEVSGLQAYPFPRGVYGTLAANDHYQIVLAIGPGEKAGFDLSLQSDRHLIPALNSGTVKEIVSIKTNPSFVGAPVFSRDSEDEPGIWLGMISHQYIAMTPGRGSSVATWDSDPDHFESHILVIAEKDIHSFLEGYFKNPAQWKPKIGASLQDQVEGHSRVTIRGLQFEEDCRSVAKAPEPRIASVRPTGGGQGFALGGGQEEPGNCTIRVTRNPLGSWEGFDPEDWHYSRAPELIAQLRAGLETAPSATIPFSVYRNPHGTLLPRTYQNLQHFFRQLSIYDRKEVILFQDASERPLPYSPVAQDARALESTLPADPGDTQDPDAAKLFRFHAILKTLASGAWEEIKAKEGKTPGDLDEFPGTEALQTKLAALKTEKRK